MKESFAELSSVLELSGTRSYFLVLLKQLNSFWEEIIFILIRETSPIPRKGHACSSFSLFFFHAWWQFQRAFSLTKLSQRAGLSLRPEPAHLFAAAPLANPTRSNFPSQTPAGAPSRQRTAAGETRPRDPRAAPTAFAAPSPAAHPRGPAVSSSAWCFAALARLWLLASGPLVPGH